MTRVRFFSCNEGMRNISCGYIVVEVIVFCKIGAKGTDPDGR